MEAPIPSSKGHAASSSLAAIENRHRHLQRLIFKMQTANQGDQGQSRVGRRGGSVSEEEYYEDGILHSNVDVVRGDVSHMSAISADSRSLTVTTVHSQGFKSPLSVLQEGDDGSLFSESGPRGRGEDDGGSRGSSMASSSRGGSRRSSVDTSKDSSQQRTVTSRHKEVKDEEDGSRHGTGRPPRRASVEPDGDYQPQVSSTDNKYNDAMRMRKEAVEKYSSMARKKASLMTNHNFEKDVHGNSTNSRSTRSTRSSMDHSSRKATPSSNSRSSPLPPPPFAAEESVHTFVGKSVKPDDASSVSSMTSMDSYLKQQYILRELERLKAREVRAHDDRDSRRDHHGGSRSVRDRRDEPRGSSYHDDNERPSERSYHDRARSTTRSRSRSRHTSLSSISERGSERSRSSSRTYASRTRHDRSNDCEYSRSTKTHDDAKSTKTHDDSKSTKTYDDAKSTKTYDDSKSVTNRSTKSKGRQPTCNQSHSTSHTPPLHQLEECCIKHPHILLSDQTDINVWTCMRYCKDEKTGRWVTKKKVCSACLEEEEEFGRRGDSESYSVNKKNHSNNSYFDDRTHALSFSEDDYSSQNQPANPNTINVYGDDGNQTPLEREAEAQRRRFIRRLAARAYHFPGNTWCEDWMQYIRNTHLVFGIFFHHPLHPVTSRERYVILLGSVGVGLLMSNLIYLWFVHYKLGIDDTVIDLGPDTLVVTKLMITLWTLGSFVHTIFDLSVWHIKACTLCRYGGEVSDAAVRCGRRSGVTIVVSTLAFATYLCLVRATEEAKASEVGYEYNANEDIDNSFFHPIALADSKKSFDFLAGYIIEFILAVFVYNPFILTIVFTGVLGCNGRIPILGGRPREMAKEQMYALKRQRYIMPQTLKLGDEEFEADMWGDEELATKF